MKIKNPIKSLTKFELILWLSSLTIVALSFLLMPEKNYLTLLASLIGITALIFVAKGQALGQVLIIIFAIFYGIISFYLKYYGEMITYLGMSAPMAVVALITWLKNPYKSSGQVKVNKMSKKQIAIMLFLTLCVTFAFYFILKALGTAKLIISTISVATSFLAAYMTFMRIPYYALGYCSNDIVLIIMWILASIENPAYIPMIMCFVMFLINDAYGFISWKRMERMQKE